MLEVTHIIALVLAFVFLLAALASMLLSLSAYSAKERFYCFFFLSFGFLMMLLSFNFFSRTINEKFNPATDDCTRLEMCPIYKGVHGVLNPNDFALNAKYSDWRVESNGTFIFKSVQDYCFYPDIDADMSFPMAKQVYRESTGRNWESCTSWQPKVESAIPEVCYKGTELETPNIRLCDFSNYSCSVACSENTSYDVNVATTLRGGLLPCSMGLVFEYANDSLPCKSSCSEPKFVSYLCEVER